LLATFLLASWIFIAISTCIAPKDRLEAIQQARFSFQHDVQAVHNDEMASGADAALTKHMTYLIYHYSNDETRHENPSGGCDKQQQSGHSSRHFDDISNANVNIRLELSLTCDAMESLYRASSDVVAQSFRRLGPDLWLLLIKLLNHELNQRQEFMQNSFAGTSRHPQSEFILDEQGGANIKAKPNAEACESIPFDEEILTAEGDLLLRKATKILGHFARVGEATEPMAHFPGLLRSLILLISVRPYDLVPWEARLSALWILANLACNAENMAMMACTAGLVQSLVNVAKRPITSADTLEMVMESLRSRSIASRAILNLSWARDNKILLAENTSMINLLAELCVLRLAPSEVGLARNSTTVQGILDTTRRHAVGALRNIAAAPRRIKIALCHHRNGHLLDVLTDAALNDPDTHVKDRALATIHNLAVYDTATIIVSHPALVLALKDVLLSSPSSNSLDTRSGDSNRRPGDDESNAHHPDDGTPRQHAAATLLVLERTITPDMDCYENLRDLLDALNNAPANTVPETSTSTTTTPDRSKSNYQITAV
jgi:hypothetical protein